MKRVSCWMAHRATVVALLLLFWALTVYQLGNWPPVHQDEPWQASPAYGLATRGVFGASIFAGFDHMDQRNYHFLPLFPVLLAGVKATAIAATGAAGSAASWLGLLAAFDAVFLAAGTLVFGSLLED